MRWSATVLVVLVTVASLWFATAASVTQSGWAVTAQRSGITHQLLPEVRNGSYNWFGLSERGLAVVGSSMWEQRRPLCTTQSFVPLQGPRLPVPTVAFIADEYNEAAPIWIMVDQCLHVDGVALFGISRHGNADVMHRGHWSSLAVASNQSMISWAWCINTTTIVATLLQSGSPIIAVLPLPIATQLSTVDHELAGPLCVIPLSMAMDDIVMATPTIGIVTNNASCTMIAFDISTCSLLWRLSLPYNPSMVHWMSRATISHDSSTAYTIVYVNNTRMFCVAFNMSDGSEIWRHVDQSDQIFAIPQWRVSAGPVIPSSADAAVLCWHGTMTVTCINSNNGTLRWANTIECGASYMSFITYALVATSTQVATPSGQRWYTMTGEKFGCSTAPFVTAMRASTAMMMPYNTSSSSVLRVSTNMTTTRISQYDYWQSSNDGNPYYFDRVEANIKGGATYNDGETHIIHTHNRTTMITIGANVLIAITDRMYTSSS